MVPAAPAGGLNPSHCPREVGGSPAGHHPPSLFLSQGFLHAALGTRQIFHLTKPAQRAPEQGGWGPGFSTPVGLVHTPAAKPTTKTPLTHPAHSCHPARMQGCRDGTVHRSLLAGTGDLNSSRNPPQPNPAGGNTIKTRLAEATTPCLLPAQPTQSPAFPSTGSEVILADPGYAGVEDGVGVSGCLGFPTAVGTKNHCSELKLGTLRLERRRGALIGNCEM